MRPSPRPRLVVLALLALVAVPPLAAAEAPEEWTVCLSPDGPTIGDCRDLPCVTVVIDVPPRAYVSWPCS